MGPPISGCQVEGGDGTRKEEESGVGRGRGGGRCRTLVLQSGRCGLGVRRRVSDDTASAVHWGRGFVQLPLCGVARYPLHLRALSLSPPCSAGVGLGEEGHRFVQPLHCKSPLPCSAMVEWSR